MFLTATVQPVNSSQSRERVKLADVGKWMLKSGDHFLEVWSADIIIRCQSKKQTRKDEKTFLHFVQKLCINIIVIQTTTNHNLY